MCSEFQERPAIVPVPAVPGVNRSDGAALCADVRSDIDRLCGKKKRPFGVREELRSLRKELKTREKQVVGDVLKGAQVAEDRVRARGVPTCTVVVWHHQSMFSLQGATPQTCFATPTVSKSV